ncbi:HugZ family protein [Martelella lutilitoris]|uniref:HugZ family protein n=1 Tax=Martelella lutilitoris TaxID=2583532 RepID=A0A7T7HLU9_9HYPH|nr:pyridoxamine 5'-phosphate oxidase family protein [Martelella lutilitoris]QQM31530.1 HugZ family protein [Martelella lutilitoris]
MNRNILRETDGAARALARRLVREAPYAALAVNEEETGFPLASRVLLATDIDGAPAILVSGLSVHTRAIEADDRVSILTGEPAKGDPLAHPRLTTRCHARLVDRESVHHAWLRRRFLSRHPKAKTYIDFPDFNLFRLEPVSANLNGGFGKAFVLEGADLVRPDALKSYRWFDSSYAAKHAEGMFLQVENKDYAFIDIDPEGIYFRERRIIARHDFEKVSTNHDELLELVHEFACKIPKI